jgi:hypothetical protein
MFWTRNGTEWAATNSAEFEVPVTADRSTGSTEEGYIGWS